MRARYYVPEAFLLSGLYRWRMLHRPFEKWSSTLYPRSTESPETAPENLTVDRIALAVNWTCRRTPWQSKCMVQALTARRMLSCRGIQTTLYMGAARDREGMIAHAWLRYGCRTVTGFTDRPYAVTGVFGVKEIPEVRTK